MRLPMLLHSPRMELQSKLMGLTKPYWTAMLLSWR
ncbi:hypothetical protein CIB84_013000 [Bambusicola thoracicus]|uniref:Uncharacterized protein n=1 Tax=Bambusicola thoracicus TaxID=9083 RepID=A0A2P4SGP3_BAMTH|nr:hypothetical protein CIB84_013000 [Bambusicola thoracicus]